MGAITKTTPVDTLMESVVIHGDLSKLSPGQKSAYYIRLCESLGLNPMTKPFEYMKLNGKETLYAKRDAADQLRKIHRVSIKISAREIINDVYVVTAQATMPDGRCDEATGAVAIAGLKGETLANAYLKCETKAKRRVTLSICGLGFLDETEVDSIARAKVDHVRAEKAQAVIESAEEIEIEVEPAEEPSIDEGVALQEPLSEYVIKAGKNKNKRLGSLTDKQLQAYIDWANAQERLHPDVAELRDKAVEYLLQKREEA